MEKNKAVTLTSEENGRQLDLVTAHKVVWEILSWICQIWPETIVLFHLLLQLLLLPACLAAVNIYTCSDHLTKCFWHLFVIIRSLLYPYWNFTQQTLYTNRRADKKCRAFIPIKSKHCRVAVGPVWLQCGSASHFSHEVIPLLFVSPRLKAFEESGAYKAVWGGASGQDGVVSNQPPSSHVVDEREIMIMSGGHIRRWRVIEYNDVCYCWSVCRARQLWSVFALL